MRNPAIEQFLKYVKDAGYIKLSRKNGGADSELERSRVQTHLLGYKHSRPLCVPKEDTLAFYEKYLSLPSPRPCLVERTKGYDFPLFFDVDFKLAAFCQEIPQTEKEKADKVPKRFTLEYTFDEDGPKAWFLHQQKVIMKVIGNVLNETTSLSSVQSYISMRTCYKFHVYVPDLIVNEQIATRLSQEIARRLAIDPDYQAGPQDIYDIIDPKAYYTGLRMMGCDKGTLGKSGKSQEDRYLHHLIFRKMSFQCCHSNSD